MGTTALIVQILIVGIQVITWATLLVVSISGFDWILKVQVKDYLGVLSVIMVALSYTIGSVMDAFTAYLEDLIFTKYDERNYEKSSEKINLLLSEKYPSVYTNRKLDQFQIRLLRSSIINFLLILIFGSITLIKSDLEPVPTSIYIFIMLTLFLGTIHSWWRRRDHYCKSRSHIWLAHEALTIEKRAYRTAS